VVDSDSFLIRIMAEDGSVLDGNAVAQDSSWHHLAVTAGAGGNLGSVAGWSPGSRKHGYCTCR